jgi:hypothetical protein
LFQTKRNARQLTDCSTVKNGYDECI